MRSFKSLFGLYTLVYLRQLSSCTALLFGRVALAMLPHRALFRMIVVSNRLKSKFQTDSNRLYEQIWAFSNLVLAAKKAQRGKRKRPDVAAFHLTLEDNLLQLSDDLRLRQYQPGAYRSFRIYDPKERLISAAAYRDRVVHHALCNVMEPIFERRFIYDSYANRRGKGTHRALDRYQHYARRFPYVLKCDIQKFFPSIDHDILRSGLFRLIRCPDTRWLISIIIDNSNPQEAPLQWFPGDDLFSPSQRRRGLPIGNLTSQFWGNVYLDRMDHFIKEELRVPGYVRYVDDFVLFGNHKPELHHWKQQLTSYLATYRLLLHAHKTQIHQTKDGIPFLGFQVFPHHRYVRKAKLKRYRRYLRKQLAERRAGKRTPQQLEDGLNAWLGHLRTGQSERTEKTIFNYLRSQGVALHRWTSGSWRVLEQQ